MAEKALLLNTPKPGQIKNKRRETVMARSS